MATLDADKLKELQQIEIELSQIHEESRALDRQKVECDAAIQELQTAPVAYKIIGPLMIAAKPADLLAQTQEKEKKISQQLAALKQRQFALSTQHNTITKEK